MYSQDIRNELTHHGVLGMKWGVRRYQNPDGSLTKAGKCREESAALREKAHNVSRSATANSSDAKRAKYVKSSAAVRVGKSTGQMVAQTIISDVLTGKMSQYASMSKGQIAAKITGLATKIAADVALRTSLAKSAMKNYTDDGKPLLGRKQTNKIVTKQDLIETGIRAGTVAASIGATLGLAKMSSVVAERQTNQARFESWGKNILPDFTDNVIWSDGDTWIVDNKRR